MPDERSVRVRISGVVQGVGFRFATEQAALRIGVRGFVRNLADRRVEAVFEGATAQVEEALTFVGEGPLAAHVSDLAIEEIPSQSHPDFQIRR